MKRVIGGRRPLGAAAQLSPDIAADVHVPHIHDQPRVWRPPCHAIRIILAVADYGDHARGDFILVPELAKIPRIFVVRREWDYAPLVSGEQAGWAQVTAESDRGVSWG